MPLTTPPNNIEPPFGLPSSSYVIYSNLYDYQLQQTTTPLGLFDGEVTEEWNTDRVVYATTGDYITIETDMTVDIYRKSRTAFANDANFNLLGWDGSDYTIDFNSYQILPTSGATNDYWAKFVTNLPAGRYKFVSTGSRIDVEWWMADSTVEPYDYLVWDSRRGSGSYEEGSTVFRANDSIVDNYIYGLGTYRNTGKYYFEFEILASSTPSFGLLNTNLFDTTGRTYNSSDAITQNGALMYHNAGNTAYGEVYTTNDVMGVACDFDTGGLYFYKNNIPLGLAPYSLNLISDQLCSPFISCFSSSGRPEVRLNATPSTLNYTPPSGFAPWIADPPQPVQGGVFLGNTELTAIKIGTADVNKVYFGDILIFENIT